MTFEPASWLCLWEKPCTSLEVLLTQLMQRLFMVVYVSGSQVLRPFFFLSSFFLSLLWLPTCLLFLPSFYLILQSFLPSFYLSLLSDLGMGLVWDNRSNPSLFGISVEISFKLNKTDLYGFISSWDHLGCTGGLWVAAFLFHLEVSWRFKVSVCLIFSSRRGTIDE